MNLWNLKKSIKQWYGIVIFGPLLSFVLNSVSSIFFNFGNVSSPPSLLQPCTCVLSGQQLLHDEDTTSCYFIFPSFWLQVIPVTSILAPTWQVFVFLSPVQRTSIIPLSKHYLTICQRDNFNPKNLQKLLYNQI